MACIAVVHAEASTEPGSIGERCHGVIRAAAGPAHLAGIQETELIYPSTGGRPNVRRMTTDVTADQQALHDLYEPQRWAPTAT